MPEPSRDVASRRERLRLPRKELASLASLDETTVGRALSGRGTLTSTLVKMDNALVAQEIALRDYLLALHPIEERAAA